MSARALCISLAVLAAAMLPPLAASQSVVLVLGKTYEGDLAPGEDTSFLIPVEVVTDGRIYVKLLPTRGNAITTGDGPNGSAEDGTGWRISFSVAREGGNATDLGTYVDSTPSPVFDVAAGDRLEIRAIVHVPENASIGGPTQTVYFVLAHRQLPTDTGETSGAEMDDATAITLVLGGGPTAPPGPTPAPTTMPTPAVGPIERPPTTTTAGAATGVLLPTWFLFILLFLLAGILVALMVTTWALVDIRRELRAPRPRSRPIEVQEERADASVRHPPRD